MDTRRDFLKTALSLAGGGAMATTVAGAAFAHNGKNAQSRTEFVKDLKTKEAPKSAEESREVLAELAKEEVDISSAEVAVIPLFTVAGLGAGLFAGHEERGEFNLDKTNLVKLGNQNLAFEPSHFAEKKLSPKATRRKFLKAGGAAIGTALATNVLAALSLVPKNIKETDQALAVIDPKKALPEKERQAFKNKELLKDFGNPALANGVLSGGLVGGVYLVCLSKSDTKLKSFQEILNDNSENLKVIGTDEKTGYPIVQTLNEHGEYLMEKFPELIATAQEESLKEELV